MSTAAENKGQVIDNGKVKRFNLEITVRAITQNEIAELLGKLRDVRGYSFEIKTSDFEVTTIYT